MTAPHLTTVADASRPGDIEALPVRPPLSRAAQLAVAASLILGGLLNGGAQYVGHLVIGAACPSRNRRRAAACGRRYRCLGTRLL